MLALTGDRLLVPVDLAVDINLDTRVERVAQRIHAATFTVKGDKPMVVGLYREYVARIATALASTPPVVMAAVDDTTSSQLAMPDVASLPATSLRLASGQLLVLLSNAAHGGEEGARLGAVNGDSRICSARASRLCPLMPAARWWCRGSPRSRRRGGRRHVATCWRCARCQSTTTSVAAKKSAGTVCSFLALCLCLCACHVCFPSPKLPSARGYA